MTTKKYRVHDLVKFQYSEIGEYIDENHTDKPLRNDEVVNLLNELNEDKNDLITALQLAIDKNEQLEQQLADVDRLIDDLGHDEMRRQYEEIFKGDVE